MANIRTFPSATPIGSPEEATIWNKAHPEALDEVVITGQRKALVTKYPATAEMPGTLENKYLMPGETIDRYGSRTGNWFSTPGTPYNARSLPPNMSPYTQYEVVKPFQVTQSIAAPGSMSGQTGLGIQYRSPVSVEILLKRGIIRAK